MRTKKSNRIGVLVPQIDSEAVPKILSGISERMDQKNYHVLLMNSNLSLEKEIGILETFEQSQVDGLIFVASILTKRHEVALAHMGVPVVILGQKSDRYPCIYHDDEGAACAMMTELLKSGCRHPAYIGVDRRDKAAGKSRYQGVCRALETYGLHMDEDCISRSDILRAGRISGDGTDPCGREAAGWCSLRDRYDRSRCIILSFGAEDRSAGEDESCRYGTRRYRGSSVSATYDGALSLSYQRKGSGRFAAGSDAEKETAAGSKDAGI